MHRRDAGADDPFFNHTGAVHPLGAHCSASVQPRHLILCSWWDERSDDS
jgi:hypothetical protein